ncbi:pyridoxal 5'-phosphate synthase glutaminase subunit PdxT [Nocardioides sp. R-C-SC26]|uniref:pyridoxal 5'-phosphate synthase glutaminase subunit PdxT n=1 Tax=Nocardioides sp. R-C-SC26 TaxID=2870414 RepID=UPI001E4C0D0E|nr:pyridoxal 5'-phosphate synthase glutaminase subunit PdxT [Nocardioides sp. R-C-SC26]
MTPHSSQSPPLVGVLALQGDVREHLAALRASGVDAVAVRRPEELDRCDALVLPGGESTTIAKLARIFELVEPIRARIAAGMPVFGTCAGMILLADRIEDGVVGQETFGGLDITVRRNAFGRQVDSFEGPVHVRGIAEPVHGVFIRAPWVEEIGPDVEVLARVSSSGGAGAAAVPGEAGAEASRIVAVRQGRVIATSFHPEVGDDHRVHDLFVDLVRRDLGRTSADRT